MSSTDFAHSDDEASFDLIDHDESLSQSTEKLTLDTRSLEDCIENEVSTTDEKETPEMRLVRDFIAAKKDEMEEMKRTIEEQKEEIEKQKDEFSKYVMNVHSIRDKEFVEKASIIEELTKLRSSQQEVEEGVAWKNEEIECLSRVNEEQRREIERLNEKFAAQELVTERVDSKRFEAKLREEEMKKILDGQLAAMETLREELAKKDDRIKELSGQIETQAIEIDSFKARTDPGNTLSGVRTVKFQKKEGKFGADHLGNFITKTHKGGPAQKAGLLRGDQLISINGINVETMAGKQITRLSEAIDDDVELVVRFNPERLADLQQH